MAAANTGVAVGKDTRVLAMLAGLSSLSATWSGTANAQERPQAGRDAGRLEMRQQVQNENRTSLETKAAESLRHARKQPLMTPQESTDAFLALDRNRDGFLSRSELPPEMVILRSQFDKYDTDRDHRLSYSEFANYTDVVPDERGSAARAGHE
ncbi:MULTISPECIES: EF-hand domain-containing protein [unclassified Rhodanobacter]|uniref:EF-hand domain-containing protein n=1 Tax=Rhodanobacter humi TaxID=1888173 RepID=A0ABV4ATQ1_9GAMM